MVNPVFWLLHFLLFILFQCDLYSSTIPLLSHAKGLLFLLLLQALNHFVKVWHYVLVLVFFFLLGFIRFLSLGWKMLLHLLLSLEPKFEVFSVFQQVVGCGSCLLNEFGYLNDLSFLLTHWSITNRPIDNIILLGFNGNLDILEA